MLLQCKDFAGVKNPALKNHKWSFFLAFLGKREKRLITVFTSKILEKQHTITGRPFGYFGNVLFSDFHELSKFFFRKWRKGKIGTKSGFFGAHFCTVESG